MTFLSNVLILTISLLLSVVKSELILLQVVCIELLSIFNSHYVTGYLRNFYFHFYWILLPPVSD